MKILKIFTFLLLLAYAAICVFLYSQQKSLLYYPQVEDRAYTEQFKHYEMEFKNADINLHGWANIQEISPQNPLFIYYGGNGDEASRNLPLVNNMGFRNFLAINYRGYGRSQGIPDEQDLKQDALFIFDKVIREYAINADSIILAGRSLGSGVASFVASERDVAKVVLITPYDSVVNVAQKRFPFFPVSLLLHQRFESNKLAPNIDEPVLCLIAENDRIIPNQHAHRLCDAWKGKALKKILAKTGHNNIIVHPDFASTVFKFVF